MFIFHELSCKFQVILSTVKWDNEKNRGKYKKNTKNVNLIPTAIASFQKGGILLAHVQISRAEVWLIKVRDKNWSPP